MPGSGGVLAVCIGPNKVAILRALCKALNVKSPQKGGDTRGLGRVLDRLVLLLPISHGFVPLSSSDRGHRSHVFVSTRPPG